jgi:hypothetical protein
MSISWIVFACVFGGALLGMSLRANLPDHHLNVDSKSRHPALFISHNLLYDW